MDDVVDVAVIGAGINGAAVGHALAAAGYRVTVLDRGDIGGGTSQASTMLIWGGLLYLKDFEFRTVRDLCRDRDRVLADTPALAQPCEVRHVATAHARPAALIAAALHIYGMLAGGRRRPARRLRAFDEQALLRDRTATAFAFEEGALVESDARFVLDVVRRAEALGAVVRTRTAVDAADAAPGTWRLALRDTRSGATSTLDARLVVNAAGGWADGVNAAAGIITPWRHALSRGVSIALPRSAAHTSHLVFDTADGNALTLAPWGPVALWASTESLHPTMDDAGRIDPADVVGLLDAYNAFFATPCDVDDVVSLRVGVRPVPVARDRPVDPRGLGLSRHHRLHLDRARPWLTVFGGKLSGCRGLAAEVLPLVASRLAPSGRAGTAAVAPPSAPRDTAFPGLPGTWVAPAWSARHEHCRTLEDYLRRRTAIAQCVAHGGFGRTFEHTATIEAIARALHPDDTGAAARDLAEYRDAVQCDARVLQAARRRTAPASLGVPA